MEIQTILNRLGGELIVQLAKAADAKELAKMAGEDQQQSLTEAEAQAVYAELQRIKEELLDDELLGVNGGVPFCSQEEFQRRIGIGEGESENDWWLYLYSNLRKGTSGFRKEGESQNDWLYRNLLEYEARRPRLIRPFG